LATEERAGEEPAEDRGVAEAGDVGQEQSGH